MANIKTTFLFELTTITKGNTLMPSREAGWTESLVSLAADASDNALVNNANGYAQRRMALLANQGKCIGFRFHNLDNNQTRAFPFNAGNPWIGSAGDCDLPQVAMLARLYASNNINNRAFELRGLPDASVITGELVPGFFAISTLNTFFQFVTANYGMMAVDKTNPHFKVKTISAAGVVQLKEDSVGIAATNYVKFYRTKFDDTCCGSVGTYKVASVAGPRSFTLEDFEPQAAHGGTVAKFTKPAYVAFNPNGALGFGIERAVIRKAGRPFDLFSGRRSRTCCKC